MDEEAALAGPIGSIHFVLEMCLKLAKELVRVRIASMAAAAASSTFFGLILVNRYKSVASSFTHCLSVLRVRVEIDV